MPSFPTADLVRQGPPDPQFHPERARSEKWCRVYCLAPTAKRDADGTTRAEFATKGPFAMPMAVRRPGTDLGSRDAWIFFSHPYSVFPRNAVFWNAGKGQKGVLEARIVERTEHGVVLYDEVGAGFVCERVPGTLPAALGVFRGRVLGQEGIDAPYAKDVLHLELDLLECFRLTTLCMKTRNPINALADMNRFLRKPNVGLFFLDSFADKDRAVIREFGALREGGTFTEVTERFRVIETEFTQTTDVKDGKGRQLVLELLREWQAFEAEHGTRVEELGREIASCDQEAHKLALELEREKDEHATEGRLSRFLSRRLKAISKIEGDRTAILEKKKQLEAEFDGIPGYSRVRGLTDRIETMKKHIEVVRRTATNVFDHNVSQQTLKALEEIVARLDKPIAADERKSAYGKYDMRLRAEVLPKLLNAYAISAYVLKRPESLPGGGSRGNVKRINKIASDLIEYFRDVRLGDKSMGDIFDETWGQIQALEGRF